MPIRYHYNATTRPIPCGCRLCGCLCAEHAPEAAERLCARHADLAVFRFIADEGRRLLALAMFVAVVGAWAAALS